MEAQLSESSVFPAQSYAASFFTKFPTDSRFLKVAHQSFMPVRIIDGKDIEFSLDRYSAGNVIMIQDTTLNVRFQILKADGTLPDTAKNVAPRNNILHTLFSSVTLHINNVQLSTAPDNYCYKAYFTNLMSYPSSAKGTHLELQGYSEDTESFFDSGIPAVNYGFGFRNRLFRRNFNENFGYRQDGACFTGRLYHELSSCETGLPPNTKVRIVLTKNKDSFILQAAKEDNEQYQVKITNIYLTVPIAQLSNNVFDELSYLMSKKEDTKPVTIQFRKFEVLPMSVPKFKQDYQTGDLFVDGDLPCRIVIAFVDAKSRLGSYHKNPYFFQRKWEIDTETNPSPLSVEQRIHYLEDLLQQQQQLVQRLSRNLQEPVPQQQTTGPISASQTLPASQQPSLPRPQQEDDNLEVSFEERVNLLITKKLEQLLMSSSFKKTNTLEDTKTFVWISSIKVTLNNSLIDQIDDSQTEDECLNSYYRLCQTTGVLYTPFTNGITYEQFR